MDMSQFAVPKPVKKIKDKTRLSGKPKNRVTGNVYRDRAGVDEAAMAARMTADTGIPYATVPGSGSIEGHKGDVHPWHKVRLLSHRWLAQLKTMGTLTARGERTITIKLDWLEQVIREAIEEHCLPALMYRFASDKNADIQVDDKQVWVLIRYEDFARLLGEHAELTKWIEDQAGG